MSFPPFFSVENTFYLKIFYSCQWTLSMDCLLSCEVTKIHINNCRRMDGGGLSHMEIFSPPLASFSPKKGWNKRTLTMVSTCLRGRSLLGACLEKTEENKIGKISTCSNSTTHHCGMSCSITWHHLLSFHVQAPLSAIPCPNVAWSRVQPHLECVGPSIIPPCKYLH